MTTLYRAGAVGPKYIVGLTSSRPGSPLDVKQSLSCASACSTAAPPEEELAERLEQERDRLEEEDDDEEETEEEEAVSGAAAPGGAAKLPRQPSHRGHCARIRCYGSLGGAARRAAGLPSAAQEEDRLAKHRRPKEMTACTMELIKLCLAKNRSCAVLSDSELQEILQSMSYFEFEPGERVVCRGEVGTMFFVSVEGALEVQVEEGHVVNTLSRGDAFGEVSLLYDCPRTASVTAKSLSGLWGAQGGTFRSVVRRHARSNYEENRRLLNSVAVLDELPSEHKDSVGDYLVTETFRPGTRVVTEGQDASTLFFVKSGELTVYTGGSIHADGSLRGGRSITKLMPGDCFGERAFMYREQRSSTVVADIQCQLLCISIGDLEEALGDGLRACLERNLIISCLKNSPVISHLSAVQQRAIVQNMIILTLKSGQRLPPNIQLASVLEGSVGATIAGHRTVVSRGEWLGPGSAVPNTQCLAAGSSGARLVILRQEDLASALESVGIMAVSTAEQAVTYARMVAAAKRVQMFRHLPHEQIDRLVRSMVVQRYRRGARVVEQGELGAAMFVIASGEVGVFIDGYPIRTLGKNACFGERALLFCEPRTATIEVTSSEVELWSVNRAAFNRIATMSLRRSLMSRIELQDTKVSLRDLRPERIIGSGSTGVVRLVEHVDTGARYALKRVMKKRGEVPEEVRRECALLGENDHPFIMQVVKTFETPSSVYMLTELITGGELWAALRSIPHALGRHQAQFYTASIVLVLQELADRNIVYRDLKPENVMLDQQGYIKLIDFGIAKKLDEGVSRTFTLVGTPHYMAPEIMRGRGYGVAADIWSLGIMVFEFVCGRLPFGEEAESPSDVCAAVVQDPLSFPPAYHDTFGRELIEGILNREPRKRLGSGPTGYDEIRSADWLTKGAGKQDVSIFDRIINRELAPPLVPAGESFADPECVEDTFPSDADALAP